MKIKTILIICLLTLCFNCDVLAEDKYERNRILILTDIGADPDDAESLIRFLLYSNQFDIEGIVATTSCWQRDEIADWRVNEIIDAYAKVRDNLVKHEPGYPTHTSLKEKVKKGYAGFGMTGVGEGKDTEGSELIIQAVDKDDSRPIWVTVWGGANCLAQALWKVNKTRSPEEVNKFVSKLRVYTISDQDDSGPWIRNTFHDLFYIVSPGYQERKSRGYFYATWIGISGERHYHFPSGASKYTIDNEWVDVNIQNNHGPLGKIYPDVKWAMEGDTPSFLFLVNNGLNSPEHPNFGSWGGRYELYIPHTRNFFYEPEQRKIWTNIDDWVEVDGITYISPQASIWRWRDHFQNDFAARMDWCLSSYSEANHPPVVELNHSNELSVNSGEELVLSANKSTDPDGDSLSFKWLLYKEVGTYPSKVKFTNKDKDIASLIAPNVSKPEILHFVVAVTDDGEPSLTRYQRVIVSENP